MVSNIIKLSLSSVLFLLLLSCKEAKKSKVLIKPISNDCKYHRYEARQILSKLGCTNCHLLTNVEKKNDRGWLTLGGLATIDSLKLIDYSFTKKHKGWFGKKGPYKTARMDTLSDCEIRNVVRYIKDFDRDIPLPSQ